MANDDFNSGSKKKVEYRKINGTQGICSIWDWNARSQKYEKRNRGRRFYAYKKVAGVQRAKSFESFEQARTWRSSDFEFDPIGDAADLTFEEVGRRFFEHKSAKLRISTQETYRSNAKHLVFFNSLPMNQINSRVVDCWLRLVKRDEYLKMQHQSRLTYRHELSLLRQIFVYFQEYLNESFIMPIRRRHLDDCIVDPLRQKQVQAQKQFRFIPSRDCELFLAKLQELAAERPKLVVYFQIAYFQMRTGCRIGEVCAIRAEDLDLIRGQVTIWQTVQWSRLKGRSTQIVPLTKTGEPRIIPLTRDLVHSLRNWIPLSKNANGLVFSNDGTSPLSYRSIQHYYNRVFEMLGMQWRSTHILRHSFATDFLEKTRNQQALQGILGHRSSRQTDHYAKITATLKEAGMKQYEASIEGATVLPLVRTPGVQDEECGNVLNDSCVGERSLN